jgi:hypothetical protein
VTQQIKQGEIKGERSWENSKSKYRIWKNKK